MRGYSENDGFVMKLKRSRRMQLNKLKFQNQRIKIIDRV